MTPQCGDALFSRFLGDNLMVGTARMLGLAGLFIVVLTIIFKLV
jgi:hypothetical protein